MVIVEIDPKVKEKFRPQIVCASLTRISNKKERTPEFQEFMKNIAKKIKMKYRSPEDILKDKRVEIYRAFFWKMLNIDPTTMRPANEALLRRIIVYEDLPNINLAVDASNLASVYTVLPMCAYDLDKVKGERLILRLSEEGEKFMGIGMSEPLTLTGKEIVLCDSEGPISIYPYRDAERTKVDENTKNILLTVDGVPGISGVELLWALKVEVDFVRKFVGGEYVFNL